MSLIPCPEPSKLFARLKLLENHGLGNADAVPATARLAWDVLARGVPGSFMECGVAAGAHPAAMVMVLDEYIDRLPNREVYLCDSFDGIPRPGPNDNEYVELLGPGNGELESTGVSKATRSQVEANMRTWGVSPARLRYVEGWFQNTLPSLADEAKDYDLRLALLRIDANLYESVKVVMETMVPLMSHGGTLILDDYRSPGGRLATDEWCAANGLRLDLKPVSPDDKDSAMYSIVNWGPT